MTQNKTQNDRLLVFQCAELHDRRTPHAQRRDYRSETSFSVRVESHGLLLHVCGGEELVEGRSFAQYQRSTGAYEFERANHARWALVEW